MFCWFMRRARVRAFLIRKKTNNALFSMNYFELHFNSVRSMYLLCICALFLRYLTVYELSLPTGIFLIACISYAIRANAFFIDMGLWVKLLSRGHKNFVPLAQSIYFINKFIFGCSIFKKSFWQNWSLCKYVQLIKLYYSPLPGSLE